MNEALIQNFGDPSSAIAQLATRQLAAYNAHDADRFAQCFHQEVRVMDHRGEVSVQGIDDFHRRYASLFADYDEVSAYVTERMVVGDHIVEHEFWSRKTKDGALQSGELLVRYTLRDGLIGYVEFMR